MTFRPVRLSGAGCYLPGRPINNEQLERVLGALDRAPPKVQSFVASLGPRMLVRGGIESRHLAIDPESGELLDTFSSMAEKAGRQALQMANVDAKDVQLLVTSSPSYDMSTPPTSALVQERLGIPFCAEMEIHSNCAGVGKSVQVAYDAIRTGRYDTALVCYSQLSSVYLRSCYYNQEKMDKVHAALRWILADGAGALVLQAADNGDAQQRVIGTYVESVGAGRRPGMTAGGAVADLVRPGHQIPQLYAEGAHHLWQDFTAVTDNAAPLLLDGICRFLNQLGMRGDEVDHYVVSIPTMQLYDVHLPAFLDRLGVDRERFKFRAAKVGYCGGATTLVHLDEMVRTGELKHGQTVIVHAVESSKWMTAGFCLRW